MKKSKKNLWVIFASILLAIAFGSTFRSHPVLYQTLDLVGTLFLNALTLIVVPLVSSSIITGISRIGSEQGFGRLGLKMFTFYLGTSLLAILIGLFFVNVLEPGVSHGLVSAPGEVVAVTGSDALIRLIVSIVPSNIIAAFSRGDMLALIFFSILFGYALSKVEKGTVVHHFFEGIFQTMLKMTHMVMKLLPLGVFCLVAKTFMTTGIQSLGSLALFSASVLLGLITFMFLGLPLLLHFVARVNPLLHFRAMAPAIVTAFSTSSSSATLPITMECVEKGAGVSNRVCSLVLPLGTSLNMSGSALYECVAAMFIAQAYGIDLSFITQFLIVFLALITSMGVAGIPSASLVAIIIILKVIGLPADGIGLFLAVDRLLDMCRTTVNVFSDSCCAVLVAKSEGEKDVLT